METFGVVLSRVVANAERSLAFYRDGFGIPEAKLMSGIVCLEMPGLTLFLAERGDFAQNTGIHPTLLVPGPGTSMIGSVLSCAIGSTAEVDRLLATARAAGGHTAESKIIDHSSGRKQYVGTVTDPDGYVWQLACNVEEPAGV